MLLELFVKLLLLLFVYKFSTLIHELGHAYYCKKYNLEILEICIGEKDKKSIKIYLKYFKCNLFFNLFKFGGSVVHLQGAYLTKTELQELKEMTFAGPVWDAESALIAIFFLLMSLFFTGFHLNGADILVFSTFSYLYFTGKVRLFTVEKKEILELGCYIAIFCMLLSFAFDIKNETFYIVLLKVFIYLQIYSCLENLGLNYKSTDGYKIRHIAYKLKTY